MNEAAKMTAEYIQGIIIYFLQTPLGIALLIIILLLIIGKIINQDLINKQKKKIDKLEIEQEKIYKQLKELMKTQNAILRELKQQNIYEPKNVDEQVLNEKIKTQSP